MLPRKMLKLVLFFSGLLTISNAILPQIYGCPNLKIGQLCCGGKAVNNKGIGSKCCGTEAYNFVFSMCCDGYIRQRFGFSSKCCGTKTYKESSEMLCWGQRKPGVILRCCGKIIFNANMHICSNNKIYKKRKRVVLCR